MMLGRGMAWKHPILLEPLWRDHQGKGTTYADVCQHSSTLQATYSRVMNAQKPGDTFRFISDCWSPLLNGWKKSFWQSNPMVEAGMTQQLSPLLCKAKKEHSKLETPLHFDAHVGLHLPSLLVVRPKMWGTKSCPLASGDRIRRANDIAYPKVPWSSFIW